MTTTITRNILGIVALTATFNRMEAAPAAIPTPRVTHAGLVASNILGITIEDGTLIRGGQTPYQPVPGDEVKVPTSTYTPMNTPQLWRKGAFVGWLVESRKTLGYLWGSLAC